MKVLLFGGHSQINQVIQQSLLDKQGAVETAELLDWRNNANWQEALTESIDFVVVPATESDVPEDDRALFRELFLALCEQCVACKAAILMISDPRVFDLGVSYAIAEDEFASPQSAYGKWLLELEQALQRICDQYVILRTTWVYGPAGENFLTRVISKAEQDKQLCFDPDTKAGPTSVIDLARVCVAMMLQLECGAPAWGVYHYCGSDLTTPYQFAEAIIAVASQYDRQIDENAVHCEEDAENADADFQIVPVVLYCHKILEAFGIKQRPWRASLSSVVKQYFAD